MSRYSNTERLGVIATNTIVTKYLGWIFREQTIVDVGIDALIEQSDEGNPTGRFLAVQIKTGAGNFHTSENKLTHYVSNIHYNYWLNLDFPIILVAHLPETEKTYWQLISEENFRKAKKRWKIEIPKTQEFGEKSKSKLTHILSNKEDKNFVFDLFKGKIEPDNLFDFAENTNCIRDAVNCLDKLVDSLTDLREKADMFNVKLNSFVDNGLNDKDPQVRAVLKGFGKDLNLCSKRLENEIVLFSELYSEGIYAYEQVVLLHYLFTKDSKELELAIDTMGIIPKSVDEALIGINFMKSSVSKIPNKYAVLKEGKMSLLDVIDLIINELSESKTMAIAFGEKAKLAI